MRSTYLAIFQADPDAIAELKTLLAKKLATEELLEADQIAERLFKDPESVSEEDFAKIYKETGREKVIESIENKLAPIVEKFFLKGNPDRDDISWGVFEVMTSDDFFSALNPDTQLHFDSRYSSNFLTESILLPNLTWVSDDREETMNEYKHGYLYAFFTVDN